VGVPGIRSGDGVPNATVDRRNGTVYAVWQDSRFSKGKRDDVLLIRSTDQGRTWSAPIKVNDTPSGAQAAFLPTVKVDANGRVGVVYYDLRNDANPRDGSFITTEWVTFSTDGGRTFGASERLSPDFDHAAAANAGGFFLGDYQGLGVSGTTFTPFFGATLETQANGQVGSDIFATKTG
jgi:Neuraminidase (sialidase)